MTDRLDSLRDTFSDLARALSHPYLAVFATALSLRLILFYVGSVQTESLSAFAALFPDGRLYIESARAIASDFNWNTQGVQVFGPGYPALLALVGFVTSLHPAWLLFCQILAGAAASVLLSILAFRLTMDRTVAVTAGLINAASVAAISLANALLSDSVFFLVALVGLLQFETAAARDSLKRAGLAGVILGAAVLIRSAGFVVLLLLPLLMLHHPSAVKRPWYSVLLAGWRALTVTMGVILAMTGAWSLRNRVVYEVAYVSKAGAVAEIRMAAAFQHQIDGTDPEVALAAISDSIVVQAKDSASFDRAYLKLASDHFWKRVKSRPAAALESYWHTTDEAVHTDWGILPVQLPEWDPVIRDAIHWSTKYPLRYRTALLSLAGLLILLAGRRYRLALTLALAYVLFALAAGLTLWQGNRIFYPGQIAWSILVAVALVVPARRFGSLLARVSPT